MLYSCTHMATVGVKGLTPTVIATAGNLSKNVEISKILQTALERRELLFVCLNSGA